MRTLAREKVNEKNMITNYDAHGFMVAAEELPKASTSLSVLAGGGREI